MQEVDSNLPQWDEYAHVYIMGLNEKMQGNTVSEFQDPKLQRVYNLGRGITKQDKE